MRISDALNYVWIFRVCDLQSRNAQENAFFLGENREWTARAAEPIDQKQIHLPAGKIWVGETKWVMLPHARLTTTEVP